MLSILYNEYKEWGCPNCGCDSAISGCFSGGGVTTGTCRHCKLTFEIRSDNGIGTVRYGSHPENPSDPKSEYVMEYARRIPHPRSGIPAWHWEPKDVRPEEGEYWSSRGVGYDLSGFVKTKAAGERILAMVHEVLGTDKCETIDLVNQLGFNLSSSLASLTQKSWISYLEKLIEQLLRKY